MLKIIFVDDDRTSASLIKMILEMDGFTVKTSPNIEQAKLLATDGVDAFVIDCNLSQGGDGIDLLRQIRRDETPADPKTRVIIVSGDDRREQSAMDNEADFFFLKPYPPQTLSNKLTELLN